jgi:hypothetical protein
VIPIRMTTGPTVRGKVQLRGLASIEGDFQIDTGSAQVLTLSTPFVKKNSACWRGLTVSCLVRQWG